MLLKALRDAVVAVSACPQDLNDTNGGKPTALRLAVYRDEPLSQDIVAPSGGAAAAALTAELAPTSNGSEPVAELEPGPEAEQPLAIEAIAEDGIPEPNPVLVQEAVVAVAEAPQPAVVADAIAPSEAEPVEEAEPAEKA